MANQVSTIINTESPRQENTVKESLSSDIISSPPHTNAPDISSTQNMSTSPVPFLAVTSNLQNDSSSSINDPETPKPLSPVNPSSPGISSPTSQHITVEQPKRTEDPTLATTLVWRQRFSNVSLPFTTPSFTINNVTSQVGLKTTRQPFRLNQTHSSRPTSFENIATIDNEVSKPSNLFPTPVHTSSTIMSINVPITASTTSMSIFAFKGF